MCRADSTQEVATYPPGTGTVTIGTASASIGPFAGGQGTFSSSVNTSTLTAGTYTVTYSYPGDTNYAPATNTSTQLIVAAPSPTPTATATATATFTAYAHGYRHSYRHRNIYTYAYTYGYCRGNESHRNGIDRYLRRHLNSFHRNSQEDIRQQPCCRQEHHLHSERQSCWERSYQCERCGNKWHRQPLWRYV